MMADLLAALLMGILGVIAVALAAALILSGEGPKMLLGSLIVIYLLVDLVSARLATRKVT